ncbi:MAG: EamA family transporter [Planctomycetes bacterium]|nr:EamA family transporter [Planctomycetota bacterium]MCB9920254.1 EamA family transporter [Planctomycetota bacterium]
MSSPSRARILSCYALLCVIWGSTWVVIKEGLDELPPFTSAAARFVVAAGALLVLAPFLARREGGVRPPLAVVVQQGTFNFALSYGIVYWSETVLPSGLVSVLWAVFPLMMGLVGHVFLTGERLRLAQALALCVGFLGVVLLFETDLAAIGKDAARAGAILLLSPLVCTIGTVAIKRAGPGISATYLNRDGLILGAVLLSAFAWFTERDNTIVTSSTAIGSVLYLSLAGTVLTFQLYFWLLRWVPAYKMSLIAFVTPAIALCLGSLVRGEPVGKTTIAGLALILVGCLGVLRGKRGTKARDAARRVGPIR